MTDTGTGTSAPVPGPTRTREAQDVPDGPEPDARSAPEPPRPGLQRLPAWALPLGVGVVVAALVVVLRGAGVLEGPFALALVGLAAVLLPTSRELSRRILLAGLIGLGWCQVLWWTSVSFDRITPVLAALVGGGAAAAAWHLAARRPVRELLGRVRVVDALPPLAAFLGFLSTQSWLRTDGGAGALTLLVPGWDNSGHFDMFRMIWVYGQTIDGLPAPGPADAWHYSDYPQGFHATLVSIAQLMWPGAVDDIGASTMAYTRAAAILLILAVVTLVAGLCALPTMRRRPEIAAPLAAVLAAAMLLGPGQELFDAGFGSFLVPCVLAGAAVFAALLAPRVASPLYVAALGGAIAGVAYGWLLLLVTMIPTALAFAMPLRAHRWRAGRAAWVASIVLVAITGVVVLRAALIVVSNGAGTNVLALPGGITPPPSGLAVVILLGATGACIAAAAQSSGLGRGGRSTAWRLAVLALSTPIAVAALAYIARVQIETNGSVGYYFWKLLIGDLMIALCIGIAAAALAVRARPHPATRPARIALVSGSAVVAVALTQVFGYFGPTNREVGLTSNDRTSLTRLQHDAAVEAFRPDAEALLAAVSVPVDDPFQAAYLQDPTTGHLNPINAQQWFMSLHSTWTTRGNIESIELAEDQVTVAEAVVVANDWLAAHPGQLVVPPSLYAALADSPDADRVLTWR